MAVLLAIVLLLSASAHSTPVEVARGAAEENSKTPAGKQYEGVVIPRSEEWLRPALEKCVRSVSREELISFDVLVRIGEDGKPEEVVYAPDTAVARCVAPRFMDASYPKPPRPSWWVDFEVRLK